MARIWGNIADFIAECFNDPPLFVIVYLLICGVAGNLYAAWRIILWCHEHVRIV